MKAATAPSTFATLALLTLLLTGCGKERIVSKYPNGKPKVIRTYNPLSIITPENVRRQQTFYYNGNPESDSYYRDGILHGPYADYWTNGQKKTVGKYRAGKKEGDWESYYNQFTLSSKGAYKNDLKEGTWYGFWENGTLKSQSLFVAGKETGTTKEWSAKSEPTAENSCFEANPRGRYVSFYANNTPKEQYECRKGVPSGSYRKQDPDGAVMERGVFDTQGRKDSVWETFHPNGKPASVKRYLGGLEQDSSYAWDEAGRLSEKAKFDSGSGERLAYDTLGHLIERRHFLKGQPDGECWIYWPQGAKRSLINYNSGKPVDMRKWHPNGKPMADGIFTNGHRSGEWKDWYETGVLKEISHFQDGALHGERQFFDPKGKLIRSLRYEHGFPAEGKIPKGLASPGSLKPDTASQGAIKTPQDSAGAGRIKSPKDSVGSSALKATHDSAGAAKSGAPKIGARTEGKVRIRLHNLDSIPLTDVFVQWPVDSAHFDSLPAKGYSRYIAVDTAYRYAYIKAKAGKRVRVCQPKDFVGESLLAPGRYTYSISPAGVLDEKDGKSLGFLQSELLVDKEHP